MKCSKCDKNFPENKIQLSHDVPKYIGGTDKDGRHYLCERCHDIYERKVFAVMVKWLSEETKKIMRDRARSFAKNQFKKEGEVDAI